MRLKRVLIAALLALLGLASAVGIAVHRAGGTFAVALPAAAIGDEPGDLVAAERIGKYPAFVAQYFLDSVALPEALEVTHGIALYRVRYHTTNFDGSVVVASGLVALPNKRELNSVVSYFHGTNAQRHTAPSQSGLGEGLLVAAATAGLGHILVAPDYIGLGESRDVHPYLHAKTTTATCIDLLRAARTLVDHLRGDWPTSLYLVGFSQGGHATFAVQRELESQPEPPFQVKATAAIAGPFHLLEVSFPQALTGETDSHEFYLAYIANAYAHIYQHLLELIVAAPYAEKVSVLFDGDHETEEIAANLPDDPRDLFTSDFLKAYDAGKPHWFLEAFAENSVDDWTPSAPVRIYYGENDVDVLPEEALRAEAKMRERGADIEAISVGAFDHNTSVLHAIPKALRWFAELENE